MLKITKIDTPAEQRIILEGRLTEPWTAELSSRWEQLRQARRERKFVVDLRGLTRIDGTGQIALAFMKREGAEFLARGVGMKHLLASLESTGAGRKSQEQPAPVIDQTADD